MSTTPSSQATGAASLRAEHDALAARLSTRRSIDFVRKGALVGFAAFISAGLSIKLAYDRWGPRHKVFFKGPPLFFYLALAAALVLAALATAAFLRARALMRVEDAEFVRLQALRRELRLDA
ncbi:hypothetical protein [Anaeromyxobacter paludicola]|uniref:DUF1049 domain-containing protein n=1 Tax=Anaeromyxobacter paludicola TaxID=2918171 RepID=A0ABM7X763_9BACT|nr:hypothetical protein [Anaeromyxobacter paludicola]BDG07669.1 hypothetical protein AMPC_07820 [Anaeromyxobacter paludicola]